jgi:bicarbonate transport system ATP-binding protein
MYMLKQSEVSPAIALQHPRSDFLTIDNVAKVYPTPKGAYTVLQDINLQFAEGEFICLIGHSGCGKSTLLNMVSGFAQPTSGSVYLRGKPITQPGPERMVVFQNYSLLPWLTAFENVYLAVESVYPQKREAERRAIAREHLAMVGLSDAIDKKPPQLSGGMRQRVAIARALAICPDTNFGRTIWRTGCDHQRGTSGRTIEDLERTSLYGIDDYP